MLAVVREAEERRDFFPHVGGKGVVEEQIDLVDIMVVLLQRTGLHDGHLRLRQPLPKAPAHLHLLDQITLQRF